MTEQRPRCDKRPLAALHLFVVPLKSCSYGNQLDTYSVQQAHMVADRMQHTVDRSLTGIMTGLRISE